METHDVKAVQLLAYKPNELPTLYYFDNDVFVCPKTSEKTKKNILMDSEIIEENQAKIDRNMNRWFYINQVDTNETYVNGKKLDCDKKVQLKKGDIIRIQKEDSVYMMIFNDTVSQEYEWRSLSLKDIRLDDHVYLYPASSAGILDEADIAPDYFTTILYHAQMKQVEHEWVLEDINTINDIKINSIPMNDKEVVLHDNDVLNVGQTYFIFTKDQIIYNHMILKDTPLHVDIKRRSVRSFFKRHDLLKDIQLQINSGEMVLLLGGSGAGKTTFVNAITGYEKAKAKVLQGDTDIYEHYNDMKYEIGFVPQQDLVRLEDSVYNTLKDAANMRLPITMTKEEKEQRIAQVLHIFGLTKQKKAMVSKLSGGQRKRLSIAIEFISDPTLFILDEPDSGLDGAMARELMTNLRNIANENRIVLVITHTPDRVIDLFDKVIVLAKDSSSTGRLAFYGTPVKAREFFSRRTMEDIIFSINGKEEGGEGLADQYINRFQEERGAFE